MIFTEEGKASIRILYLFTGYGLRRVIRQLPGKRQKTFGLDNLITKLLKGGGDVQARTW